MQKSVLFLLILVSFLSVRANNVQLQETVKIVSVTNGKETQETPQYQKQATAQEPTMSAYLAPALPAAAMAHGAEVSRTHTQHLPPPPVLP